LDFSLSEEQQLLQETVRAYAQNECPPQTVRGIFDDPEADGSRLWQGLVEIGVGGLVVPERLGGAGLGLLELALVSEELGRGAVPVPFLGHSLACLALAVGGSPAQQERWLPALASGEVLGTVALAESGGGSEAGSGSRWEPESWQAKLAGGRISGTREFVPVPEAAQLAIVGCGGGELALLELGADGVRRATEPSLDRSRPHGALHLADAPADALAPQTASRVRDAGLVMLAADAFGAGQRLVRMSADYAMTRQQFGQPIAQFQAVKHQLADMALEVDPTRGLWWYAAHAFDQALEDAPRAAALAKAHITERVQQLARDAVEIHGGLGFTWECDVQIWFKRVAYDRLFLGSPESHRERVAQLGGW
jgi:alkylation response protein AidB-like acyl-CoA dehydrogenase